MVRAPFRVAVVQFNPKIGQVASNLAKARQLCAKIEPKSVDLICLPEMFTTGYVFPDSKSILPHLEWPITGPTSRFCRDLATKMHAWVAGGYPERLEDGERETGVDDNGNEVQKVGANSAVVYGPDGELMCNYRKTNLFKTDMSWAKAGSGFGAVVLCSPPRQATLGICMDLNAQPPAVWDTLDGPYELARHHLASKSGILILLNAWLDSEQNPEDEVDEQTINYWSIRLRPLWSKEEVGVDDGAETMVVVCNRTGEENGATFAGSSCLFKMAHGSGRPILVDCMGRREEGVRIWTV